MIRLEDSTWDPVPSLKAEMQLFEARMSQAFSSGSFIQTAAAELIAHGGKRLRPAMTIAAAHLGDYKRDTALPLAMAIEAIHTATLIHDDVIDAAETRRGHTTVHAQYGNHVAIYAGDFLLARGLRQIAGSGLELKNLSRIAEAVEVICAGEVSQYLGRSKLPGYRTYLKRIMSKTGVLFAAAASSGGYSADLSDDQIRTLWHFGMRFGAAFQIRDDIIDIDENTHTAGKPTGSDLVEGIVTLPVLLAAANQDFRDMLDVFFAGSRSQNDVNLLISEARRLGALGKTKEILNKQLTRCRIMLDQLPAGEGRDMLSVMINLLED